MPKYIYLILEWTFLAIFLTAMKLNEPNMQLNRAIKIFAEFSPEF